MKKLFVPLMFDEETHVASATGVSIIPGCDTWPGFFRLDDAKEHAKALSLRNPKGKVVIFESACLIEPRKVEFAEKTYNSGGELIV